MKLLPPHALIPTGAVDHADWNFRPVLGRIQRTRFELVEALLPERRVARLLELGYGSGVFLTTLSENCEELYGLDVHGFTAEVGAALAAQGVAAKLFTGTAERLPFADATFDAVVAVSMLEFVSDLDAVCREVTRVLRPDGSFVVVTPGRSAIVDAGLRLLTGESARRDFGDRRERIVPTLERHFTVSRRLRYPGFVASPIKIYEALQLTPKG